VWFAPSVNPPADELGEVVVAAGGKVVTKKPTKLTNNVLIVVGDQERAKDLQPLARLRFKVYEVELLIEGVLTQELDLHSHIKAV